MPERAPARETLSSRIHGVLDPEVLDHLARLA
jgi:hypothetical protein